VRLKHYGSRQIATVFAASLLIPFVHAAAQSVDYGGYRPHYQGYGVNTPGGRGGAILRVSNLNDSGSGSLRAALEATGPRFVIFETSGTIALDYPLYIKNPYLTIAGQTAPSPGINIRNFGIYVDTHDVVIQHIRIREGDTRQATPGNYYSLAAGLNSARDIVFDHVSVGWAMYQAFAALDYVAGPDPHPTRVSILDSLIAFPLSKDYRYTGYGGGMGHQGCTVSTCQYTYARNLFVHTSYRQPSLGVGRVNVVNNVVYGSGPFAQSEEFAFLMYWQNQIDDGTDFNAAYGSQAAIINTVTIPSLGAGQGPTAGSDQGNRAFSFDFRQANISNQDTKIWLSGNQGPYITGPTGQGQRDGIWWNTTRGGSNFANADIWYTSEPSWHSAMNFETLPTDQVADYVFTHVGARALDRDAVDASAVEQARAGLIQDRSRMGSRVTSQNDMGGHPVLARNTRVLQIPANPHAIAAGQSFRTNIEMWLETFARALEPGTSGVPTQSTIPPPQNLRVIN
jgi:pectate lyase